MTNAEFREVLEDSNGEVCGGGGRSLYALVCGLVISRWVLAALGKTDFGCIE